MEDLVILLPGITGSVLSVGKTPVFEATNSLLVSTVLRHGRNLDVLKLPGEPGAPPVEATGVFLGPHWLLGMGWVDGYGPLSDAIVDDLHTSFPFEEGNFYHFPYDWREDNRRSAAKLGVFVGEKLGLWRELSRNPEARVIFLAHSMGGLVARHYLDVLGGWDRCRALVTFGTPYRGSVEALKLLAEGVHRFGVDITDVVRSFPSLYQLMPIYPVVEVDGEDYRIVERDLPNIDRDRAEDAREFYLEMIAKVEENRGRGDWAKKGYETVPVIGLSQRTMQSARLLGDGTLEFRHEVVPQMVNPLKWDGDGTVPQVSAVPLELDGKIGLPFIAERHSSLQVNPTVLTQVIRWLYQSQAPDDKPVLGGDYQTRASLGLDLMDAYPAGRPVAFRYALNDPTGTLSGVLQGIIEDVNTGNTTDFSVKARDPGWHEHAEHLKAGVYRITLRNGETTGPVASPVHGIFEVVHMATV